jgi:hypothetical protein
MSRRTSHGSARLFCREPLAKAEKAVVSDRETSSSLFNREMRENTRKGMRNEKKKPRKPRKTRKHAKGGKAACQLAISNEQLAMKDFSR